MIVFNGCPFGGNYVASLFETGLRNNNQINIIKGLFVLVGLFLRGNAFSSLQCLFRYSQGWAWNQVSSGQLGTRAAREGRWGQTNPILISLPSLCMEINTGLPKENSKGYLFRVG